MASLDARLKLLEDACERGSVILSQQLARSIGDGLPDIRGGMPVGEAFDVLFREQETLQQQRLRANGVHASIERPPMSGARSSSGSNGHSVRPHEAGSHLPSNGAQPLAAREALSLTRRIKAQVREACLLLAMAHERRVWQVLGYKTWEQYVHKEFGFSRARSYEILDQATVIRELMAAAGTKKAPDINAYKARRLKPVLSSLVGDVRELVRTVSHKPADEIIQMAVARRLIPHGAHRRAVGNFAHRTAAPFERSPQQNGSFHEVSKPSTRGTEVDWATAAAAVNYLAGLPATAESKLPPRELMPSLDELHRAIRWLTEFANRLDSSPKSEGAGSHELASRDHIEL